MKAILIDDHALFRAGLEGLLRRRGVEVISFSNGAEGIESVRCERPDVVMVDLRMPELDGIQTLKTLRKQYSELPILILTTSDESADLTDCLHHQASGYLLKDMDPDELVAAMKRAIAGEPVVAPQLASKLASIIQQKEKKPEQPESIFDCLSPRETEILRHLTEGQSNKRIGLDLGISDGTVKLHVKSILKKLGLHSRVEAAVLAVREGLFPDT